LSSPTVSTKLARIAEQSKRDATLVFTTLAHLMDEDFLTEAFHQLRKDAAAGIDEMTVTEYAVNLWGANSRPASADGSSGVPSATGAAGVDTQRGRRPATAGHTGAGR
jgi:hypothetical protein